MDPITHTLSGFVISRILTKNRLILAVIVVTSLIPDIDVFLRFFSRELFLIHHRGITHGIGALFLFPLLPAIIFRNKTGFIKTYAASFLAYSVHLFFDLTNQYGTKIFSPFEWNSYTLSLTFIIDPYVLFPFLIATVFAIKIKKYEKILCILSLVFVALYIGSKAYLKTEARDFLKEKIEAHQYRLYPLPNDFLRWWFVARYSDEYITGFVDLFTKRVYAEEHYRIINDEAIIKSKEDRSVRAFLSFAKHPMAQIKKEGSTTVVLWRELSYGFLPNDRFTVKVWLKHSSDGYRIINSSLKI
uniref:Metal-dependent hydrolase n=1 Tax=Thermodesulfovibrio aggregans TaxID=86166 RepID=A0A7C4AJ58_9BACT